MKQKSTRATMPALVASIVAILVVLMSTGLPTACSLEGEPSLVVKPYLQLGNHPRLQSSESLELTWFASSDKSKWRVLYKTAKSRKWVSAQIETKHMEAIHNRPLIRYIAKLDQLVPGGRFQYKLLENDKQVMESTASARKTAEQPSKFAVFGDIGAASAGQKKVAYQCFLQKPDYVVMPGDIVYGLGLVSEYLLRFFPIMNGDTADGQFGAPLLRSTIAIPALGNHDLAFTQHWNGTDMTRFPDALGYFIFWSLPLNGPHRSASSKNVPYLSGSRENQIRFKNSAGEKFPTMANFSFDYGNCHWLILDANPYMNWTDEKLREWVEKDLESAKSSTFKFVSFHQPGFSDDTVHKNEHRMRLLSGIFEKHNVDIVFAGHAHNYQRTFPLKFKIDEKQGKPLISANG
ncbi:MAG: metallophosphoesterase, partial [Cyanobacteria bacterium]|nr:metallophosphoesterase [Cyanobacteriota bacterium]